LLISLSSRRIAGALAQSILAVAAIALIAPLALQLVGLTILAVLMIFGWLYIVFGWIISPLERRLWMVGVLTPVSLAVLGAFVPVLLAILVWFTGAAIDGFDASGNSNRYQRWANRHGQAQWIAPGLRYVEQLSVPSNQYWSINYGPSGEPTLFNGLVPFFLTSWASTAVVYFVLWTTFNALAHGSIRAASRRFGPARQ
jgi:hypothetical protein